MPSFFIVTVPGEIRFPRLYVSQKSYEDTLRNLRNWRHSHEQVSYVYIPQLLSKVASSEDKPDPEGCGELILQGRVDPEDRAHNFQLLLGDALDRIPNEQALLYTQRALDYLNHRLIKYGTPQNQETTGS